MNRIHLIASNSIDHLGLKAAEDAYQERLDRDERNDKQIAAVQAELRATMAASMNGNVNTVPSYRRGHESLQIREVTQSAIDCVLEALDSMECAELLAVVLAHSTCETVRALKVKLAERYARDNAEEIAQARGLLEG